MVGVEQAAGIVQVAELTDRVVLQAYLHGDGFWQQPGQRESLKTGTPLARLKENPDPFTFTGSSDEWISEFPGMLAPVTHVPGIQVSVLYVPLTRDGRAVGLLSFRREGTDDFSPQQVSLAQTFADQAVIAIENARLFKELEERNRDVTEALDQQTAMAEVLSIIAGSTTDSQRVLDAIANLAVRVFNAHDAAIHRFDDGVLKPVAVAFRDGVAEESRTAAFSPTVSMDGGSLLAEVVKAGRSIHAGGGVEALAEAYPVRAERRRMLGIGSFLATPLMLGDTQIGTVVVERQVADEFLPSQIELFEAFAAQAVIAIENARCSTSCRTRTPTCLRLSNEKRLRVASFGRSVALREDLDATLRGIAVSARAFARSDSANIYLREGDERFLAATDSVPGFMVGIIGDRFPLISDTPGGEAMVGKRTVLVDDLAEHSEYSNVRFQQYLHDYGERSAICVPIVRDDDVLGLITVTSRRTAAFTRAECGLVESFADQAAIAIENARLIGELRARNRDVTEALDQQTAMADVLDIISRSATDATPVLDAIAERAARLSDAGGAQIQLVDGGESWVVARSSPRVADSLLRPMGLRAPVAGLLIEETLNTRATVHFWGGPEEWLQRFPTNRSLYEATDWCWVSTPLLRDDAIIGCLQVFRMEARPFTERQIALIETFADQAVIAIENARLFAEIQAKRRNLRRRTSGSKSPASTSRSSWRTCPTSCGRR